MKYLFVTNQCTMKGYTPKCEGAFLGLLCETKCDSYTRFPNEFLLKEELCCVGAGDLPEFELLVAWDKTNLAQILHLLKTQHPRVCILSELLEWLTNHYKNSFEYNLCIHGVLQRANYPAGYHIMPDFTAVLSHEIELPVSSMVKDIERPLPNNYLQNRIQNGIVNTFSQELLQDAGEILENGAMLDRLFTSSSYYFLQDLKSLYFLSKLRITGFLWGRGEQFLTLERTTGTIHLAQCSLMTDSTLLTDTKIYKGIISLFDGYRFCNKCMGELFGIYNCEKEFNYNLQIIKNFCDKYGYFYNAKENGNFKIITDVSEWFLDISINSSRVTNLFHKSVFEGGSCRNKGKKRKLFRQGFHLQGIGCRDLIYVLNYIRMHDLARLEEKQRIGYDFISEKYIQKNFKNI